MPGEVLNFVILTLEENRQKGQEFEDIHDWVEGEPWPFFGEEIRSWCIEQNKYLWKRGFPLAQAASGLAVQPRVPLST